MGIHGLNKFVLEKAPDAIAHVAPQSFMGRTVAVDASTSLYAFMIAIRDSENYGNLTNEAGEATSHIAGMLSRAIRMLELGMKPIYVFDGKPPVLKSGELARRKDRKAQAEAEMKEAQELGDDVRVKQLAGRMVKVTKKHNDDVKKLLKLMGVPIIEAPAEAESQCAILCRAGKADATVSEDSDSLCFGTPLLLRSMNFTDKKQPVMVYYLDKLLRALDFNQEQFIEFCILCGCDYCDSIKGIGPATAFRLLKDHGSIERIVEAVCTRSADGPDETVDQEQLTNGNTDSSPTDLSGGVDHDDTEGKREVPDGERGHKTKGKGSKLYELPSLYPWAEAKQLFVSPDVIPEEELKNMDLQQKELQEEALRAFLIEENQFNETRVHNAIERLKAARRLCSQTRLDNFFTRAPTVKSETSVTSSQMTKGGTKSVNEKKRGRTTGPLQPKKKAR